VVLVFAVDPGVIPHIERWVAQLDQYSEDTPDKSIFSYAARYTTAANLARTLNQFLGSGSAATAAPQPAGGSAPAAGESRRSSADKVVVDEATNTLILQASPESYSQILRLLRSLDKPSKAALVEMTVAEVTLTENSQLGVEWLFRELTASGAIATGGTFGGLGVGTDGFTFTRLSGDGNARVLLNALASNNRARILSSPRIMARNGEEAMIQVGQEVPIISSQQSTVGAVDPDGVGVLQTIQYRDTGVILKVKPTIHSGDRVDLDVSQEVSAAQATTTGVDTSPTFATRKLETKLTLQNGSTVLLGGLISSDQSAGDTGVPFLKDIPLLGRLFRRDTNRESKTELIVLITPYIVNDDIDARAVTQAFKSLLGSFADERLPGESAERADPPLPTGAAEPAPPPAPAGPAAPPAVPEAAAPAPG
ncbi:MAG TPA: secretin N-terminal domain-containing protein, partial [Nevskiaceae bacterium]|nr:secretin N-terminal domain-containing protein [Nevskiaceae bacterium]